MFLVKLCLADKECLKLRVTPPVSPRQIILSPSTAWNPRFLALFFVQSTQPGMALTTLFANSMKIGASLVSYLTCCIVSVHSAIRESPDWREQVRDSQTA